jgi:hypothetical protein
MAALRIVAILLVGAGLVRCDRPREIDRVLSRPNRIEKSALQAQYLFLKSVVDVKSPGPDYQTLAACQHLVPAQLVRFIQKEEQVDLVALDPLYDKNTAEVQSHVLASFPATHLDIVRKRNSLGEETHEEEENTTRKNWTERAFIEIDLSRDLTNAAGLDILKSSILQPLEQEAGALNFVVELFLRDGTTLAVQYSFLRYEPSATYQQRQFSAEEQLRFGFFKTSTFAIGPLDQVVESDRRDYMNRWDTARTLVFYFSPDFPPYLKGPIRKVFNAWSQALRRAVGDPVLELRDGVKGQSVGDLRYSMIHFDHSSHSSHGVLGYAPVVANPRTGEILKADVVLYGKVLRRSSFRELIWEKSRNPSHSSFLTAPSEAAAEIQKHLKSDFLARITRIQDDTLMKRFRGDQTASEDEIETRILSAVFAHEFGHALGLRHNFLASADKNHFASGDLTSSVMDYSFLHQPEWSIGEYDHAALQFGYSPSEMVRKRSLTKGFLYCSDEEVFTSKNPLCQPYDSARSLSDLVAGQLDRYFTYYDVNNRRLDRLDFEADPESYEKRILAILLPIRLAYDNAQAILEAFSNKNYPSLWELTKQRIEADGASKPNTVRIKIETGSRLTVTEEGPLLQTSYAERILDTTKIWEVAADARVAKQEALVALRRIILDSSRSDTDEPSKVFNGRIERRGVLQDKLLALTLLLAPSKHPVMERTLVSPYSSSQKMVAGLLASLLSNTSEVLDPEGGAEPYYRIRQFNNKLREHALNLIREEIAVFGRSPGAENLIQVHSLQFDKLTPYQKKNYELSLAAREEFREFYVTLMQEELKSGEEGQTDSAFFFADMSPFEQNRNTSEFAFTEGLPGDLLAAPLSMSIGTLKTASGLLIRNNLNVAEDYLNAIGTTREHIEKDLFSGSSFLSGTDSLTKLDAKQQAMQNYIDGEKSFLKEMFKAFTRHKAR